MKQNILAMNIWPCEKNVYRYKQRGMGERFSAGGLLDPRSSVSVERFLTTRSSNAFQKKNQYATIAWVPRDACRDLNFKLSL